MTGLAAGSARAAENDTTSTAWTDVTSSTTVDASVPSTSFDGQVDLEEQGSTQERRGYFAVTVTGVPSNATGVALTGRFFKRHATQAGTLELHSTSSFDETTLVYNNAPAVGSLVDTESLSGSGTGEYFEMSLGSVSGNGTYYYVFTAPSTQNAWLYVASDDYTGSCVPTCQDQATEDAARRPKVKATWNTWTLTSSNDFSDSTSWLTAWYQYDTRLSSGVCTRPSHAAVTSGVLRLRMAYRSTGTGNGSPACGAEWYTGTAALRTSYGGTDIAVQFDMKLTPSGVTGVNAWQNWVMGWPSSGTVNWWDAEQDFLEGVNSGSGAMNLHYQNTNPCCVSQTISFDKTAWHNYRVEVLSTTHKVRIYVDGTLAVDYTGDADTVMTAARYFILQQECYAGGSSAGACPSGTTGEVWMDYDNLKTYTLAV